MSEFAMCDGLVINSNLAQPIPKRGGAPNPGVGVFERLEYYGRKAYYSQPANELPDRPYIELPDEYREDPFYGAYGFLIPSPVRLRIAAFETKQARLNTHYENMIHKLVTLGRGINFEIANPDMVEISTVDTGKCYDELHWKVIGEGTSTELLETVRITAMGVRGHAVAPIAGTAGLAILEPLT